MFWVRGGWRGGWTVREARGSSHMMRLEGFVVAVFYTAGVVEGVFTVVGEVETPRAVHCKCRLRGGMETRRLLEMIFVSHRSLVQDPFSFCRSPLLHSSLFTSSVSSISIFHIPNPQHSLPSPIPFNPPLSQCQAARPPSTYPSPAFPLPLTSPISNRSITWHPKPLPSSISRAPETLYVRAWH